MKFGIHFETGSGRVQKAVKPQMTPGRENMGTDIPKSMIDRAVEGVRYVIQGVTPESWFGPLQPQAPQAQEQAKGRKFDFPVGLNLNTSGPRQNDAGGASFRQLRALAESYDLLRLVIETRKDQVESYKWDIVPKDEKADKEQFKEEVKRVKDFLEYPDREHPWGTWLRMMLEDLLVIDAVAIYPRPTRGGDLWGFELVDGGTIKLLIDETGRSPLPPSPAYQQILKGMPAVDYTRDELVYVMRNPRTWKLYGMSPVEQIMMTVNIALRRQIHQLQFYTEGNVPEALAQVPENWSVEQVKEFQLWWDSLMEGNTAQRRHMKFLPSLEGILFPKAEVLKDDYDEWLARIICFAFSITPGQLTKMMNRAAGEQMAETAKEEGLVPLLQWIAGTINQLIAKHLGSTEVKFAWDLEEVLDAKTKADVNVAYVAAQIMTPDEARESIGKEPLTDEQKESAWPTPDVPELDADGQPTGNMIPGKKPGAAPGDKGAFGKKPSEKEKTPVPGKKPDETKGKPFGKTEEMPHVSVVVHPPNVYMGDTINKIAAPEPAHVTVGDVNITHAEPAPQPVQKVEGTVVKHVRAWRDEDGTLRGEITQKGVMVDAIEAERGGQLVKTLRVEREEA